MIDKRHVLAGALSLSLLATTLPALAIAQEDEPYAAEAVTWGLASGAGLDGVTDVPEIIAPTLFLSDGQVVGSAGCNSYFGSYEIDAENLSFGPLATTLMLCEGPAQELEDTYLALLAETTSWVVDEDVLSLSTADGTVSLVFVEPPVDITATDIAALTATLEALQSQIDVVSEAVAELDQTIGNLRGRISANEDATAEINETIGNLRGRISANEAAIAEINETIGRFRNRINRLEDTAENHEARISALEGPAPATEPSPAPAG